MSDSTKITENLLTAVDIIVEEKLRVLDFDRTEQYTIVDNSKADSSIYTISDGSVSFEAYALTNVDKYKVGDIVIVSIPKSDFSNPEKTILRLATKSDNDETGRISRPFDQIVDVSGNLISQAGASRTFGLAANFYQDSKLNSQSDFKIGDKQFQVTDNDEIGQPQLIRIIDITDESILRYTNTCPYIGLSAKFTAPLGQGMQRVISGDYGIKLSLYLDGQNDIPGQTGYITNEDMFGDSYNYVAGVTEQKVMYFQFNRTERSQPEHQITRITIDFFQGGNFINYQGDFYNLISDDSGDPAFATKTDESIVDNLFVSELYLCSAFDKKDYVANKVEISSNHSVIYNQNGDNTAKINVSWLYCGDDIPRLVFEKPKNNIKVRWYAYAVGQPGDKYGGIDWSLIKETEDFEASIVLPTNISQYEIKAIIIDTDNFYTSYNTLIFLNYNYIELYKPEYDMKLVYSDQTNGLYPWYNLLDELIDGVHSYEDRTIHPAFLDGATLGPEIISQIKWTVPDPQYGMLDYQNDEAITGMLSNEYVKTYSDNSTITYIKNNDNRTYTVTALGTLAIQEMFNLKYRIKSKIKYNPIAHIVCELQVTKSTGSLADKPHIVTTDMQFLQESSSGSPYSLIIRAKNNEILTCYSGDTSNLANAYAAAEENGLHSINLEVFMIGKDNELIKFDGNISNDGRYHLDFTWKTIKNLRGTTFYPSEITTDNQSKILTLNNQTGLISLPVSYSSEIDNLFHNNYYIVQVTVSPLQQEDTWQRNIIGYFSIPIRYNQEIINLVGTSSIIYNSDGSLKTSGGSFYPFILEVKENTNYGQFKYKLSYFDTNQDQDIKLKDNLLQASPFYLESFVDTGICIQATTENDILLWSQPIIILQQAWPSSLINKWDGKLQIDEENNYILTAMIGAGTKNSNNQFSGVLLGNIAEVDKNTEQSIRENTGIYGFRNNVQVYAFKDDGTAFIGSNEGRLNFDGNNSRIYNSAMVNNQNQQPIANGKGLLIDFDDALIHSSNGKNHVYLNGLDTNYPLAIGNVTNNNGALDISHANFYLNWNGQVFARSGNIGGWQIGQFNGANTIWSTSNINGTLYSTGLFSEDQTTNVPVADVNRGDWRFRSGTNFGVTKQGNLYANNGTFKGAITATSLVLGSNAKDTINSLVNTTVNDQGFITAQYVNSNYIRINRNYGSNTAGSNFFLVETDGLLTARNALIYGTIVSSNGEIGGWSIRSNYLASADNGIRLYASNTGQQSVKVGDVSRSNWRIIAGNHFGVDSSGNMYANSGTFSGTMEIAGKFKYKNEDWDGKTIINAHTIKMQYTGSTNSDYGLNKNDTIISYGYITGAKSMAIEGETLGCGVRAYCNSGKYNEIIATESACRISSETDIYLTATNNIIIRPNGSVRMGTTTANHGVSISGDDIYVFGGVGCSGDGQYNGFVRAGEYLRSGFDGNYTILYPNSTLSHFSDIRLKTDFIEIDPQKSLFLVESITPFLYKSKYLNQDHHSWGYSAQELKAYYELFFPELDNIVDVVFKPDEDDYYSVNYLAMIPHFHGAIKTLHEENEQLKSELSDLKLLLREKGVI